MSYHSNDNRPRYRYEGYTFQEEEYQVDKEREQRKRQFIRRKKRKRLIKRMIFAILMIVSISVGHVAAKLEVRINHALNVIVRNTEDDLSTVDLSGIETVSDDEVINVLLVGSDKRTDWTESGRSDSVMIGTLDMKNKQLKITSLMRDMYVSIPGYADNRFNAAYSFGGVSLVYQTIAKNFGLSLDGYVIVDFDAFISVIDTIGGVDITLTDAEQEYLVTAYKKGTVTKVKKGLNTLNGKQALAYTRIRQDSQGDFGRTERQRKVLQAIFMKVKAMSLTEIFDLAEEVLPYITTDLTNDEIYSYVTSIIKLGTTEINQFRIPIDHSYTNEKIREMAVLVPDLEANRQALYSFIFGE